MLKVFGREYEGDPFSKWSPSIIFIILLYGFLPYRALFFNVITDTLVTYTIFSHTTKLFGIS